MLIYPDFVLEGVYSIFIRTLVTHRFSVVAALSISFGTRYMSILTLYMIAFQKGSKKGFSREYFEKKIVLTNIRSA